MLIENNHYISVGFSLETATDQMCNCTWGKSSIPGNAFFVSQCI